LQAVVVQRVEYGKACRNNRDQGEQMAGIFQSGLAAPVRSFLPCGFIWIQLSRTVLPLGTVWRAAGIAYGTIGARDIRAELVILDIPADE
jgi:hypothetical protein